MLLHHDFIQTAKKHANKVAFIDHTTGKSVRFDHALIGSLLLAKRIRVMNDEHIGILLPTSAGSALATVAVLNAGKTPVMINYSTGAEQNIHFARQKAGFHSVITSRKLLEKIGCPEKDGMVFIDDLLASVRPFEKIRTALLAKLPTSILTRFVAQKDIDDTAALIFTSGSEKEPKGVQLSHRNVQANLAGIVDRFHFTSDDRILAILPSFHVFGYTVCLWLPLKHGMTSITYGNPLDIKKVVQVLRQDKPTIFVGTPYFLMSYLKQSTQGDFDSLKYIVTGADKTPDWLHHAVKEKHGKQITEGYGATETSPVISVNSPEENRIGSIGRPLKGYEVRIVDIDTHAVLPAGQEGKILVKGDSVMKGYFRDPEQTAEKIRDGWYDTGDMGMMDEDGFLWHRGRLKRFVKIGGEMVSLARIEAAAEKCLPENVEFCAVEIPDEVKGSQIALALTQAPDPKRLKEQLLALLPPIAVPKFFVHISELPKMASGKIDFRKSTESVREQLAQIDKLKNQKNANAEIA